MALDREQIGEQSAGQHDDEAGVGQMDAELAPAPAETFHMSGDQIDEQDAADQMTAGKNRDAESASFRRPPDKQALEIALLRFVNPEMHLGERPGEDQRHRRGQTGDRQLQRGKEINESVQHLN